MFSHQHVLVFSNEPGNAVVLDEPRASWRGCFLFLIVRSLMFINHIKKWK